MTLNQKNKKKTNMMEMCANMSVEECQAMMRKMVNNEPEYRNMQIDLNDEIISTPELQALFFEWCNQIKKELQEYTNSNSKDDIDEISQHFNLSKESCDYLLNKMNN